MPGLLKALRLRYGVTPAQAELCRVDPNDPSFHVVDLPLEAIRDIIRRYLQQFMEQYSGFHLEDPIGILHLVGYGMKIRVFIYTDTDTESTGYSVKVSYSSNVKLLNLEELSAVLKWHFDPVESRGSMPLITDFTHLLQSGGGSTEIG